MTYSGNMLDELMSTVDRVFAASGKGAVSPIAASERTGLQLSTADEERGISPIPEESFECGVCGTEYDTEAELQAHGPVCCPLEYDDTADGINNERLAQEFGTR